MLVKHQMIILHVQMYLAIIWWKWTRCW